MSDDPISVPEQEQTEEQKADQEKQFAQADLLKEVLEQLKPQSAQVLQTAQSLEKDGEKDAISQLADSIDQLAQAARNAQGRLDTAECSQDSYAYKAVRGLGEYADLAHHDAKQAADAAGDNDEVKNTSMQNVLTNLNHADGPIQGA